MSRVMPNLKIFIILTFVSIFLLVLDTLNLLGFPKQIFALFSNPISYGIYNTNKSLNRQFYFIFAARFAAQENKALKMTIGELLAENAQLRKELSQLQALVAQDKFFDSSNYSLVPVKPIGLGRYLKINKGLSSGVKVGQAVVFEDNFIGKIISTSGAFSQVQLVTDPDSKIAAFSQNKEGKAKGVLVGQFGTEVLLDKILHEEKVVEGDLVYSEGLEGFLPRGLILGKVIKVIDQKNEVFKQAKVQPVFDVRDLELVFVMEE